VPSAQAFPERRQHHQVRAGHERHRLGNFADEADAVGHAGFGGRSSHSLAVVADLASHEAQLHTGHTLHKAAHHLDQPDLVLERLHRCDIHDGGGRRSGAERRAHTVGSNARVDDTAPRIRSPPQTPCHLHGPLPARDDVGGELLEEPATDCQLRAPPERVLPAVDDRSVEVRHAARNASGTGNRQNDAGRVVDV